MQAVSCLAVTPHYLLSASDDSNINVWPLARLLELDTQVEHEPELTLSNHRGGITSLVAGPSTNPETSICVSSSKDKTCIIWNYRTGQALRTLLFSAAPLCARLDLSARALFVTTEAGAVHLVELFGERPLLGAHSAEQSSIVVQVTTALGIADEDTGPASCLAVSYDGTVILTGHTRGKIMRWSLTDNGHPTEVADLNAAVTNLAFVPLLPDKKLIRPVNIVKPNQALARYSFTARLDGAVDRETRFGRMLNTKGFPADVLYEALQSIPATGAVASAPNGDR